MSHSELVPVPVESSLLSAAAYSDDGTRQTIRTMVLGRHSHEEAYAAMVLSGSYEEAGDQGRFQAEAGDVVLHDSFEAHLDRFPPSGAVILNVRLAAGPSFAPALHKETEPNRLS
jgi:hypothetical protein